MRRARAGSGLSEKDGRSEVWDAIDECLADRYRETHLNYVSRRESGPMTGSTCVRPCDRATDTRFGLLHRNNEQVWAKVLTELNSISYQASQTPGHPLKRSIQPASCVSKP